MKKVTYTLLALVVLAIGALFGYNWLRDNRLPNFRQQAEIYVYPESTAEEVLEACDWLTEAELYVNPRGVRMARGYAEYSGNLERRYYIESQNTVMLMCMIEDERFYDKEDCEAVLLEVADAVCPR